MKNTSQLLDFAKQFKAKISKGYKRSYQSISKIFPSSEIPKLGKRQNNNPELLKTEPQRPKPGGFYWKSSSFKLYSVRTLLPTTKTYWDFSSWSYQYETKEAFCPKVSVGWESPIPASLISILCQIKNKQ